MLLRLAPRLNAVNTIAPVHLTDDLRALLMSRITSVRRRIERYGPNHQPLSRAILIFNRSLSLKFHFEVAITARFCLAAHICVFG